MTEKWPWYIRTRGKGTRKVLVELTDLPWVRKHNWFISTSGYPFRHVKGNRNKSVLLHREVLGETREDMVVDHINGDRFDARRSNLRSITTAENNQNVTAREGSSGHRGVHFDKRKGKWVATGHKMVDGKSKSIYVGAFETEEEAVEAIIAWRRKHLEASNEDRHLGKA